MQFWNSKNNRLTNWTQSAFSDQWFWIFFLGWLVPIIICGIYIWLNLANMPSEIPLFYSRIWGEGQLANKMFLFLPTGGVLLLGIFDLGVAVNFHSSDRVLSYLLGAAALLLAILDLVTTINIVNLMR